MKLKTKGREHRAHWQYFTTKAEAEAATCCGSIGVFESSPGHTWRAIVRFEPACPDTKSLDHDESRCAIISRWAAARRHA